MAGRRLLIWGEQGIGDQINFASLIPFVEAVGAECTFECDLRLTALMRRAFPGLRVYGRRNPPPPDLLNGGFDFQTPLLSLARWFHPGRERRMPDHGYLIADEEKASILRARYDKGDGRRLVGISWHTRNTVNGCLRSIPLTDWVPLLSRPDVRCVNLQYGNHDETIHSVSLNPDVELVIDSAIDPLTDIDSFAAQIAAMDLIITTDNSTAHLAGALGKPVWNLLHQSPESRWLRDGDKTIWYPSMRLFRQRESRNWIPVLDEVARALDQL